MSLLKSITTIAGASVISQIIGAVSIWLISHKYNMSQVGIYALVYSIVLIGAQICTFASQLLLPKQNDHTLSQNIVFSLLQSMLIALPYSYIMTLFFEQNGYILYVLTLCHAWILVSENLLLRVENIRLLAFQRISVSLLVIGAIFLTPDIESFYFCWAAGLLFLIFAWLTYSVSFTQISISHFSLSNNLAFIKENRSHLSGIGSAEVLAMANNNLPTLLINFWFSPLTAGYFAVVNRFCLAPVTIIGNAVRNSIFSKWSIDFRNNTFNFQEFKKVRLMLLVLGLIATAGVLIFYPLIMQLGFNDEWLSSVPTSRYMLPYLLPALAVCPLTVIELVFGSPKYFLRIQIEQLLVIVLAFVVFPYFHKDYAYSVLLFAVLSFIRYAFIYLKVNKRAHLLAKEDA
ncbi:MULTISPECIES: lipopolysaccharide biosynthesis protein [Aliivibrio]|uniref:lipopolysaccharide biosynthesis protein n=1 Tax=Aliivibrio TaxID=511678 RepID=UPI0002FB36B8|nr:MULTISPECIES: capsular polysaccharide biosynthesis protein [Aliivibrio]MBD1569291.1 capsular biosynthesis protein [Aliivibrio sp. S10_S31]OCH10464.1 capsular biosynthesis protein [Aliivibrio fischeri]OCH26053.1 capsular biosynthesis protein [Aliivibrio fischeri]OCH26405.1 capsular biosynthesis protein [Aliivibrio fischeri]OCH63427.1 capsular biosynthesis protein [Aliivibrio fischeri]